MPDFTNKTKEGDLIFRHFCDLELGETPSNDVSRSRENEAIFNKRRETRRRCCLCRLDILLDFDRYIDVFLWLMPQS